MKPCIMVIDDYANNQTIFKCTNCGVIDTLTDFEKIHMTTAVLNHVCRALEQKEDPQKC